MIARPPQQQLHSYHLALSVLLLLLTIYPYLFNHGQFGTLVAAHSNQDLGLKHLSISSFDIIDQHDIYWSSKPIRSTRDTQLLHDESKGTKHGAIRKLQFSSLGRIFGLILEKPAHLVTSDLTIVSLDADGNQKKVSYNQHDMQIYTGHLEGDSGSKATASIDVKNKIVTAQIKTAQDILIVEPVSMHKDSLKMDSSGEEAKPIPDTFYNKMIVYNLKDHADFSNSYVNGTNNSFNPDILCPSVKLNESIINLEQQEEHEVTLKPKNSRNLGENYPMNQYHAKKDKRSIEFDNGQSKDKTRCTLHLVADYLFYKNVGHGDRQTTINYLLALINRVNEIYLSTLWITGDDGMDSFSNIGFTVQNITIHDEFTKQSSSELHYNMQSDRVWAARELLDNFSKHSPSKHYCLAHLLTYRQFNSTVLGLAYVASSRMGTIGGICSPTQQKGNLLYKHNTGISTSKGIRGETLITRQADLVLAHELGHNFGSEHDSDECRPSISDGGAFLMHPYAVMGFENNNRLLSNCSRLSIGRVLKRKASTCFVSVKENICGNGIVEDDEQCDGGAIGLENQDPCCDSLCRFTPGSRCSERHSLCCSKCQILQVGFRCRPAEENFCEQASYCDGRDSECPSSPPSEDNTPCMGRGLCIHGNCTTFCEARKLHSCLCTNPKDACRLCCQTSHNSTCLPYDIKAPYLPDGVSCYRGVCEKGRCEQPVQDFIERLWDVIEDINYTTFVKFLRDNIILVVLVVSIPIWCLVTYYVDRWDERVRDDFMTAISKRKRGNQPNKFYSPFLPRLFVGDTNSADDIQFKGENSAEQIELSAAPSA